MTTAQFHGLVATVWIAPMMPSIAQYIFAAFFFVLAVWSFIKERKHEDASKA